jgi:Amt family ammonium transporter
MHIIGILDTAGGLVVHVCSGVSGVACTMAIKNKMIFGKERHDPVNIMYTYVGLSMMWVGWFGFNAG